MSLGKKDEGNGMVSLLHKIYRSFESVTEVSRSPGNVPMFEILKDQKIHIFGCPNIMTLYQEWSRDIIPE